jgi:SAM-dependent methyltransferase
MTNDKPNPPIALETRAEAADRLFSPSAARNREPILDALRTVLPTDGNILEIGSGTGEHVAFFAKHLPKLRWQPSEFDEASRRSIRAWIAFEGLTNVAPPLVIDARAGAWGVEDQRFDAIISMNMIHIAPWEAAQGLFAGAGRLLKESGCLFLYGPFKQGDRHNAPSNEAFDHSLQTRNAEWGVRDIDDLSVLANAGGLRLARNIPLPANNQSLVFVRHTRLGIGAL